MPVRVELWTDGSGTHDPNGPGGWAFVLRAIDTDTGEVVKEVERSGGLERATNQRAEMEAVLQGLVALTRPTRVTVYSDSEYVLDGFRKGWVERWRENGWRNREGESVANRDLWVGLHTASSLHGVTWMHVKGHKREWVCPQCGDVKDDPPRRAPRSPIRTCDRCSDMTYEQRMTSRDKFPLNARCDKLAGAARKKIIEAAQAA